MIYGLLLLAVIVLVIGILFRILHWEIASIGGLELMTSGSVVLIIAILLRYLLRQS